MTLTSIDPLESLLRSEAESWRQRVEPYWNADTVSPYWQPRQPDEYDVPSRGQCAPTAISFNRYIYQNYGVLTRIACGAVYEHGGCIIPFHVWLEQRNSTDQLVIDLTLDQGSASVPKYILQRRSVLGAFGLRYEAYRQPHGLRRDMFERADVLAELLPPLEAVA